MTINPDQFNTFTAIDIVPVTPSDTVDLTVSARAIRCTGASGTLRITSLRGNVRNTTIVTGEVLPVGATRIHETGTAASGLEALI